MRIAVVGLALALAAVAVPATAMLAPHDKAPDFSAPAAQGGTVSTFHLADALKRGPVVVYFYPEAFTKGCTIEAHLFAAEIAKFKAMNATVVGVSHDDIEKLKDFSTKECSSKFPVMSDPKLDIAKQYDAVLAAHPTYANRTTYVIAQDGTIAYAFTDLDPTQHVKNALAALEKLKK